MATPIDLLTDFEGGQGGGSINYVTYAEDLDTNFGQLETTVNQLVEEVTASLGLNNLFLNDLLVINDPNTPLVGGTQAQGVIGEHSYEVSINGSDNSQLFVQAGSALVGGVRVSNPSQATLQGSGGAGTRWVAIDSNGALSLELSAGLQSLDLVSITWNGTIFTGSPTQIAPFFPDGDDYAQGLARAAIGTQPSFSAKGFRTLTARINAIERLLAGVATDSEGTAVGPANMDDLLADADGSAATPWLRRQSDPDTGAYWPGANRFGIASAGLAGYELTANQQNLSATQYRFRYTRTTTSLGNSGTLAAISFDTQVDDVGGWDGGLPDATLVVPTGGAGFYVLVGAMEVAADTSNSRLLAITLNGAGTTLAGSLGFARIGAAPTGTTNVVVAACLTLAAADTLRLEWAQDSVTGSLNASAAFAGVRMW